ncbi:MAG: hypothetical protein HFF17_07660 [Oscillospiraceae bacterium]|nr:hypothetical protein [Oscillospiraceae bacterium]
MKILRKMLIFTLFSLLLAAVAAADVIVEPADDFWGKHQDECDYLYRAYTVNGAAGYAALWESPVSQRQTEVLANGAQIAGQWHYTDSRGVTWCAVESGEWTDDGYTVIRGWISLSDCVPVPDYISFREAHGNEFIPYDGSCDRQMASAPQVVLWKYPGSGIQVSTVDTTWFQDSGPLEDQFETCWRDGEGRLWGYSGYCFGIRNTWICLSDPGNPELAADPDVLPEQTPLIPAASQLPPAGGGGVPMLAVVLVAAAVVLSAVLIAVFFSRKRRAGGAEAS